MSSPRLLGTCRCIVAGLLGLAPAPLVAGQISPETAREPLRLATLQRQAAQADPRQRELQLQTAQTDLRRRNIAAERLPMVSVEGQAQYQSDVPTAPSSLPNGRPLFSPPHAMTDAYVRVQQHLLDPTIRPRLAIEQAQLDEAQARVRATLFEVRQEINELFFTAALLQEQMANLAATTSDLEARLRETTTRVHEGVALPGEAAAVEATLWQRRQDDAQLRASRHAALVRLALLTGRGITDDAVLVLPDVADAVKGAQQAVPDLHARPEYDQFARARERLARQQDVAVAQDRPQLSAFARAGYGRPGLNFISDRFEGYWLAGLQVQWKAWTWGAPGRERETLALERQIVLAEETSFADRLRRAVQEDLASLDRLETTLSMDDRIVALRQDVERETAARFREGVITASEYLDRSTDLMQARLARAAHRVELAQVGARFLTTLGLEVP